MSWNLQANEPAAKAHIVRLVGGSSAISIDEGGHGMTVSRTSAGLYKLTWGSNPGTFLGWSWALGAATPANVAGHSVVRDEYDASTKSLAFTLYAPGFDTNAVTWTAHDLAASEYLDIVVRFVEF